MKLEIFRDNACDYVLQWIVVDKDKIDECFVKGWTKFNIEHPEHQLDIYSNIGAYDVIATFRDKVDAEMFIKMKEQMR